MHTQHVLTWLDHNEAHVIHFNRDESEATNIDASGKLHLHVKVGGGKRAAEDRHYLDQIVDAIKDAEAILIVGPDSEKLALFKHMMKYHHTVAEKVVAVETCDHPSDGQLLAYARKYFVAADRMRVSV